MQHFKDFNIKTEINAFTGDKLAIRKILNREIIVLAHKIENSKYDGKRLDMQIELNGTKHVIWTSSKPLMDTISKVPPTGFPFKTTIVQDNEWYEFT